jgi:hypothetical protein
LTSCSSFFDVTKSIISNYHNTAFENHTTNSTVNRIEEIKTYVIMEIYLGSCTKVAGRKIYNV